MSPRHVDYRSKFIQRKKLMKSATNPNATAGTAAAKKEGEDEGVDPDERKWRLEDPKQSKENTLIYLGSRDVPPRKEIHQAMSNHYAMLIRQEGKFLLVPMDTYSFRHIDSDDKQTLEEAEQKMKTRMKRFEKRVRNMSALHAAHDEDDGANAAAGGGAGGLALERARPTGTTRPQNVEKVERADDAFADVPTSNRNNKASALAKAAKVKREEGADYNREFDDDDVDGNDDRLDGQGGEASDREPDDEQVLAAEQAAAEAEAAAVERKKQAALQKKSGMSFDEAEEEQEWAEAAADAAEDEDEEGNTSTKKDTATAKRVRRDDDSDDEFDDSDLSLDDESDEEEKKDSTRDDVVMKTEPLLATTVQTPASRKRPVSPATSAGTAAKKIKTESGAPAAAAGSAATAATGTPASAAAAAAPPTPAEMAELERLVVRELLAAPPGQPYTSKSLAQHLNKKLPQHFNKRSAGALRDVLKKVVSILPDKTHIILKKEYQQQNLANK